MVGAYFAITAVAAMLPSVAAGGLPPGVIVVPLVREVDFSSYLAEFSVGTPPQREWLKVDTGSPTYSFENSHSQWCLMADKPCARYGSFDNTTSVTSIYESGDFSDFLIDFGSGDFLNDTVVTGGVSTPHMYFGYIDQYPFADQVSKPTTAIAGLSLDCGFTGPNCDWAGPWLLPELKNASAINRIAVSFYLGPESTNVTNSQMILGGGYDRAKQGGVPFTLPMVDPHSSLTNHQTNNVNVTALTAVVNGNTTGATFGDGDVGQPVLMDTGNPYWYIPDPIFSAVLAGLGNPTQQDELSGVYIVDCKYRSSNASNRVSVEFGKAGKIDVPLRDLVVDMGNGTCSSFVQNGGTGQLSGFGDPFLRSTYVIFDDESLTMTFSQVKYTDEQDIVAFPPGGFQITAPSL